MERVHESAREHIGTNVNRGGYQEAYADRLFTLVPRRVIERSVPDAALRERVLGYYRSHRSGSPFGSSER